MHHPWNSTSTINMSCRSVLLTWSISGCLSEKPARLSKTSMAFPSHTNRSQITVKQLHYVSSHLSITTTINLATHLPLTKPTSKSVVSKLISGSSWTLSNVPLSDIRYPITVGLDLASLPCVWHSAIWKSYQKLQIHCRWIQCLSACCSTFFSRIR